MVDWKDELLRECFRAIDSGGGEVRIQFAPRKQDKLVPIIKTYLDNQTICKEIEVEED